MANILDALTLKDTSTGQVAEYEIQDKGARAQIAKQVAASTDSDADYAAEVVDARVGADGESYASLGEAIRGQRKKSRDKVESVTKSLVSLLSSESEVPISFSWESGGVSSANGEEVSTSIYTRVKGFIQFSSEVNLQFYPTSENCAIYISTWEGDKYLRTNKYRKTTFFHCAVGYKYRVVIADVQGESVTPDNVLDYVKVTMVNLNVLDETLNLAKSEVMVLTPSLQKDTLGYILTPEGTLEAISTSCFTTNYIDVRGYTTIEYTSNLSNKGAMVVFYTKSKRCLSELSIVSEYSYATETSGSIDLTNAVYSDVAYIRLCHYVKDDFSLSSTFSCRIYRKNSIKELQEELQKTLNNHLQNNYLKGKTINVMGDSISSTDYERPNWWEIIAENTGAHFNNYGQSGTTLAHTDSRHNWDYSFKTEELEGYDPSDPNTWETGNCFVERVDEMDVNADAVIIMGGTNDSSVPRGAFLNAEINTFFGALDQLIQRLLQTFMGKPIIFCTMIQSKTAWQSNVADPLSQLMNCSDDDTLSLQLRAEAIKVKCRQYGIPCIDLYNESGINGVDNGFYFRTDDTLHPSSGGQKRIASIIQNNIEKYFEY